MKRNFCDDKRNFCDENGNCTVGNYSLEQYCRYVEFRSWQNFNTSCKFEKRTGVDSYQCTNKAAREEAGCDDV